MDNIQETKLENFDREAKFIFRFLVDKYGYKLLSVNKNSNSVYHYYLNEKENLKIEISNAPYYTDYGFTFFIYNLDNDEYLIACNIPHENQDNNSDFIINACNIIFSNDSYEKVINGKLWIKQNSL